MKADDIRNIAEAYNSIYEAVTDRPAGSSNTATTSSTTSSAAPQKTFQQQLDDLRKASAQATMAGPSKEAQDLMSQRTKNILGPEKLAAGIKAQQEVEKMKSEIGAPKPQAPVPSTTQTRQPQPPPPPATPTLTKDQLSKYNQATGALKNPLTSGIAKGRVKDEYGKMTPEQKKIFRDYLNTRPQSEKDLYKFLGEQQIGVPLKEPTDRAAKKAIESTSEFKKLGGEVVLPKTGLQKAHYELEGEVVIEDVYDEVLEFLLSEGCTLKESNYIMTYVVEQGMHPQEIMARGIANILGLDKPHPTQVFAQGLRKMLFPNKPQPLQAPKAPAPKLTKVASPAAKPTVAKPNPYRPGATVRATGPDLNKFPELQRFAGQANKIVEPVARTAAARLMSTLTRRVPQAAVAATVLAPRPTADGTLSAALKRGDYRPMQGPPAPKSPKPKSIVKPAAVSPAPKPVVSKPATPEDPDIKKYNELRKSDPTKAKELGMKIWSKKYQPSLTSPEVA